LNEVSGEVVPYSNRTATSRWALTKGVAMTIGFVMLIILWIVIAIFIIAAIVQVFRSAAR
jgi:hypothetical protein